MLAIINYFIIMDLFIKILIRILIHFNYYLDDYNLFNYHFSHIILIIFLI